MWSTLPSPYGHCEGGNVPQSSESCTALFKEAAFPNSLGPTGCGRADGGCGIDFVLQELSVCLEKTGKIPRGRRRRRDKTVVMNHQLNNLNHPNLALKAGARGQLDL